MARSGRGTITRSTYRTIPKPSFYIQLLNATLNMAGVITKNNNKTVYGNILSSSSLIRYFTILKLFDGLFTPSGSIIKDIATRKAGSISSSGFMDDIFVIALALVGAVTSVSGSLDFIPSKYLTAQLDTSSAISRSLSRALSSSVLSAGSRNQVIQFGIEGYLAPFASTNRRFSAIRLLGGSVLPSQTLSKVARKPVHGNITAAGTPRRIASKLLAGAISMAATLVKQRVGDINAISASISVETIISIVMVYEDKSVVLSIDGI